MSIHITRKRGYYGKLRALVVRLDGAEVARLGDGQSVDVHGTGDDQVLRFHMDWMASAPITVRDPEPSSLVIEVAMPPLLEGLVRTFFAPRSAIRVQVLDASG